MMQQSNNIKNIGMKLTPQRLAILACLEGNTAHPSAEDIYKEVRHQYPTMSFATVYNTLEALKERGQVVELSIDPRRRRYDPDTRPHHHLICLLCGTIRDVHESFRLALPEDKQEHFRILGSQVEFYGICPDCDKKNKQ
jgi:Fur family peroxide stress response transcriptional regulator